MGLGDREGGGGVPVCVFVQLRIHRVSESYLCSAWGAVWKIIERTAVARGKFGVGGEDRGIEL